VNRTSLATSLLLSLIAAGTASAQKYKFSEIVDGLQPTTIRRPYSISNDGTILLQPYSAFNIPINGLLIKGSTIQTIAQPQGNGQLYSLSNNGYISGTSGMGVFYLDPEYNVHQLQVPVGGGRYATGINSSLLVVGMYTSSTSGVNAWTCKNGNFAQYVYPGSTECTLNGVNDNGDMVGTFFVDHLHTTYTAFLVVKGKAKAFAVSTCVDPLPSAISNNGIVVGTAISMPSKRTIGFVRSSTGVIETIDYKKYAPASIPAPSGTATLTSSYGTEVFGVNSSGVIVGMFTGTYATSDGTWSQTQYFPFMATP